MFATEQIVTPRKAILHPRGSYGRFPDRAGNDRRNRAVRFIMLFARFQSRDLPPEPFQIANRCPT